MCDVGFLGHFRDGADGVCGMFDIARPGQHRKTGEATGVGGHWVPAPD